MTVYIDIKRDVCARVILMFAQVIKDNNIKATRAVRIQVQVFCIKKKRIFRSQNGTILIKYKYKD